LLLASIIEAIPKAAKARMQNLVTSRAVRPLHHHNVVIPCGVAMLRIA